MSTGCAVISSLAPVTTCLIPITPPVLYFNYHMMVVPVTTSTTCRPHKINLQSTNTTYLCSPPLIILITHPNLPSLSLFPFTTTNPTPSSSTTQNSFVRHSQPTSPPTILTLPKLHHCLLHSLGSKTKKLLFSFQTLCPNPNKVSSLPPVQTLFSTLPSMQPSLRKKKCLSPTSTYPPQNFTSLSSCTKAGSNSAP